MNLIDSIFPCHEREVFFRPKNYWNEQDNDDEGKDDISIRHRKEYCTTLEKVEWFLP